MQILKNFILSFCKKKFFATNYNIFPFLLIAPAALLVLGFILYPLYTAINLSFYNIRVFQTLEGINEQFTLDNYRWIFTSRHFWNALKVTIIYSLSVTLFSYLVGLGIAILLNQKFYGRTFARTVAILPWPVAGVVVSLIFTWMFNPSFGIVNYILFRLNLISEPYNWLTTTNRALAVVTIASIWKLFPFFCVMILSGLQSVPQELYEASQIDGANNIDQFRYITFPALRPVSGVALVLGSLWAFRRVDIIYIITGGGPSRTTETLSIQVYREAFEFLYMGTASAIGVVLLVLTIITTFVFLRYVSKGFY